VMDERFKLGEQPTANFVMGMGGEGQLRWNFAVRKTLINRIRYWLFCKFFPFKIIRWDSDR